MKARYIPVFRGKQWGFAGRRTTTKELTDSEYQIALFTCSVDYLEVSKLLSALSSSIFANYVRKARGSVIEKTCLDHIRLGAGTRLRRKQMLYASRFAASDREFITSEMQLLYQGTYCASGASTTQLREYTSITFVDIGGYTVDVLVLHNFKVDRNSYASLRMGTITLFNDIHGELQQEILEQQKSDLVFS